MRRGGGDLIEGKGEIRDIFDVFLLVFLCVYFSSFRICKQLLCAFFCSRVTVKIVKGAVTTSVLNLSVHSVQKYKKCLAFYTLL